MRTIEKSEVTMSTILRDQLPVKPDEDVRIAAPTDVNPIRSGGGRHVAGPLTRARQPSSTAVLLVAAFGAFLAFLDSTIVNIAFPAIQRHFHGESIGDLSWVLNAYNIVFGAFLVAAGRLTD